jgi:hypothetical protein
LALLRAADDLWTSVEVRNGRAIYEVRTGDEAYQDRLQHVGFADQGGGRFTRNLSDHGDVAAIHRRFARHLEELLLQSARRRPVPWPDALTLFLDRVEGSRLNWFLYGSGALAVRGLDVDPGDLDFWVDDAELAGEIFEDLLIEPVTEMRGWIADRGGRAFAGCIVEWISQVHPDVDRPSPHEQGPTARGRLEQVAWHGRTVAVAPLDLQLAVAERRGRTELAARIRDHMAGRG